MMAEQPEKGSDFESEFRRLGENLKNRFQAAWNRLTNQDLQDEIKSGFEQLAETVNEIISGMANSPSGQRLQEEVEDFGDRIKSGEVEAKVREELLGVLDKVNAELEKIGLKKDTKAQDDEET